jgi:hypothetical protein
VSLLTSIAASVTFLISFASQLSLFALEGGIV